MSEPGIENNVKRRYYLSNRDLLVIAILSGIGGVLSTYVGYLGNLLNRIFVVPFGAKPVCSWSSYILDYTCGRFGEEAWSRYSSRPPEGNS